MKIAILLNLSILFSFSAQAQASFDLQGHRGARGLAPENSLPAFKKALEFPELSTLELDVVVTKDKKIVVSHEPWMNEQICRYPDGSNVLPGSIFQTNIYQMDYETVVDFDCGSRVHPRFPEQVLEKVYKPLLEEVINMAESKRGASAENPIRYNIETKSLPKGDGIFHPRPEEFARLLYDLLVEMKILNRVSIQSFDVRTLQELRKIDEYVNLVLLVENELSLQENIELLGFEPDVYSPNFLLVNQILVEEVHKMGKKIIPWTVNEIADMEALIALGIDGLITDYPDRAATLLKKK